MELQTTQADPQLPQRMQMLTTLLPQLSSGTGLLQTATNTALQAFRANEVKLSGLVKECGPIAVDLALTRVLKEVFDLTLSPVTSDQLAGFAEQIRTGHFWLGFEEIIFAIRKGINGGYGQHFGHINYQHVANWLSQYHDEREQAIVNDNESRHLATKSPGDAVMILAGLPKESIENIGRKAEQAKDRTRTMSAAEIDHRLRDGAQLVAFEKIRARSHTWRLLELQDEAEEKAMDRTYDSVTAEIERRINFSIREICERVSEGQKKLTDPDRELVNGYRVETQIHLKNILNMIIGFEEETQPLTPQEEEFVPSMVKSLKKYIGRGNEITNKSIREGYGRLGFKITDSRIRKIINHIRRNSLVPMLCANSRGYYVAANDEEMETYKKSLKQRIGAIKAVLRSLEKQEPVKATGKFSSSGPTISEMVKNVNLNPNQPNA